MFPYAMSAHHEGAKRNTIGVTKKKTNVKLSYCTGHAQDYPMEDEMPPIHHAIKQ